MFAVTAAEFTAEGTANILVNRFTPLWGCPPTLLSDNGLTFCAQLATAAYKRLGIRKLTTSAYHPLGNGGVERVNHTMAQMLAMVCNEHQNDWNEHLPHAEYACNNSVSAATSLAPNVVHIARLPCLPLAIFDRSYGGAHQGLDRDHLAYCYLARERQQRTDELVREQHALAVARVSGRNSGRAPSTPQIRGWWLGIPPPPYDKNCAKASLTKFLKRNSLFTERNPSKLSLLVPPQRPTNQTGTPSRTSFYALTSHRACPVLSLNLASRWQAANLAPTLMMLTTCPDIFRPVLPNTFYTLSRPSRLHTMSLLITSLLPQF